MTKVGFARNNAKMSKESFGTFKKLSKQSSPVKVASSGGAIQRSLVPPVLQEVGKLAAGVAAVAGGSATGNPRNKHALQPGHSLMDWIRLGSSGQDLTGVGPRAGQLSITPRQLAQHDKATDAWIAIRGKVYNVTHYFSFHPGGPDELMRGIGKDATSLFDQVHAWVNYEKLLQKCYLGQLVAIDPALDTEELFFGKPTSSPKSPKEPPKLPNNNTSSIISSKIVPSNKVSPLYESKVSPPNEVPPPLDEPKIPLSNKVSPSDEPKMAPPQNAASKAQLAKIQETGSIRSGDSNPTVLPRFDWIQKTDYITLIFYTKPLSNPQVEISPPNVDNTLTICLKYEHQSYINEIRFLNPIQWPCQVKINYETGKVEVQFKKAESRIWENYGVLKQRCEDDSIAVMEFKFKYTVVNKVDVNYNTSLLELQRIDGTKLTVPIGRHVRVFISLQGDELSRSYTPVPSSLFTRYKPQTFVTDNVCLMIKSYPKGSLSKYICHKKKGDILEISKPLGSFSLNELDSRETFLLLAAGTGITPMLGVLLFLLERRIRRCQNVTLLFFNRTEEDILVRSQLDMLQNDDPRFKVEHVLSQSDSKWKGLKGQISQPILQEAIAKHLLNTIYKQSDLFSLICGPTPFTNLSQSLLTEIGFSRDQMHLFLG